MRRGNSGVLAVPAPPVIASGDDGGDGQEVQGVEPEFFGIKAVGRRICFICDGSGSMGAHFSQLKTELVRLVASLPEGTQFVVMFFSGKTIGSLKWRSAGAQGARSLEKDLADTTSGGSSDPTDAIKIAFQMKKVPRHHFLADRRPDRTSNPQGHQGSEQHRWSFASSHRPLWIECWWITASTGCI